MTVGRLEVLGVFGITDKGRELVQAADNLEVKQRAGIITSETAPANPQLYDVWIDIS